MAYITSSQAASQGSCQQSAGHIGGTQFYFTAKKGQRIQVSTLGLTQLDGHNANNQEGYVVDEGEDKVTALGVHFGRSDPVKIMDSQSNEVAVSIHGGHKKQFVVFLQGEFLPKKATIHSIMLWHCIHTTMVLHVICIISSFWL